MNLILKLSIGKKSAALSFFAACVWCIVIVKTYCEMYYPYYSLY